jgi:hypothetical protein
MFSFKYVALAVVVKCRHLRQGNYVKNMHLDYPVMWLWYNYTLSHKNYGSLPLGPPLYEDEVYNRCDVLKQYTGHED